MMKLIATIATEPMSKNVVGTALTSVIPYWLASASAAVSKPKTIPGMRTQFQPTALLKIRRYSMP